MPIKRVLCQTRLRRIPPQFSWVDHRLVRDKHICRCDVHALALYLFLVTVSDAMGLSYYSDASIAGFLSVDAPRLAKARQVLQRAGLIAYEDPLYQVLALEPAGGASVHGGRASPPHPTDRAGVNPDREDTRTQSGRSGKSPVEMLRQAIGGLR